MPINYSSLKAKVLENKKIIIYFLGGAGFIFKFSNGKIICLDPYLSDAVERLYGFKRLFKAPITPDELYYDMLLLTHEHGDHLDTDIIKTLYGNNPNSEIVAPINCGNFFKENNIDYTCIKKGDIIDLDKIRIISVDSDHGDQSPEAVGFIIQFSYRSLYVSGDSSYNLDIFNEIKKFNPNIIIPCINGAFGNMSETEAADLVNMLGSEITIPSHYGLFEIHGGNANRFKEEVHKKSHSSKVYILNPGEGVEI